MNNANITINNDSRFVAIELEPCDDQAIIRLPKKMKQALIAKAKEKEVSISELTRDFYLQLLNS